MVNWRHNSEKMGLLQITVWMVAVVGRGEGLEDGRREGLGEGFGVGKGLGLGVGLFVGCLVGCFFLKNTQQNGKRHGLYYN